MKNCLTQTQYICSPMADATLAGDRAAIYHRGSRNAITLNPVGTILWQVLNSPRTVEELVRELQSRWPAVEDERAREDVHKFLTQLREHDLVDILNTLVGNADIPPS